MKINKLSIKGFRSFSGEQVLDFNNLDNGLIFVSGENLVEPKLGGNGTGKSSLFEALSFVLYGKTSVNLKAGDIKNWNSNEKCEVVLEFEQNDGEYVLKRTWNPNTLTLNEKTVTQEELNKVVGMNFDSFSYSVFISQFGQKFLDYIPSEKLNIFTSILEDTLGIWDDYVNKVTLSYKECLVNEKDLDNSISRISGKLSALESNDYEKLSNDWEKNRKNNIKELEENINESKKELTKFTDYLNNLDEEEKKLEEVSSSLSDKRSVFVSEAEEYKEKYIKCDKEITALETEIKGQDVILRKNIEALDFPKCPVCKQEVNKKILNKEIASINKKLTDLHQKRIEKEKELDTLEETLDSKNKELKRYETELFNAQNKLTKIREEKIRKGGLVGTLSSNIEDYQEEIENLEKEVNPILSMKEVNDSKIKMLKRKLSYEKEEFERNKRNIEIYKYWQKGFKDIKLMLTSEALDEFEIEINNNLQNLGLPDWKVKLLVDTETKSGSIKRGFNMFVKSPVNKELVPFECWSGGEGQRIRIATTLGLVDFISNKRGSLWNILVLDEISQHLSNEGIEDLLFVLRQKAIDNNMKIFNVDHKNLETYGMFSGRVHIVKTKDGSIIE